MLRYRDLREVESKDCSVESYNKITRHIFFAVRYFKRKSVSKKSQNVRKFIASKESGFTMLALMAMMAIIAIGLLAVAPSIQQSVQREKELESIRRGEEIAEAIKLYVEHYRGAKLPNSIDDLLEGLPQGTKKRQILRPSAAVDPLSKDGKWRLISPTDKAFVNFAKRVQDYNNGLLPATPSSALNRYAVALASVKNTESEDDLKAVDESEYEVKTSNTSFIGVSSQSKSRSVLTYYGVENHSKWLFTPMFRGAGASQPSARQTPRPARTPRTTR